MSETHASLAARIKRQLSSLADIFFPPICLCCGGRLLSHERHVCTGCLASWPKTPYASVVDNDLARLFWGIYPIRSAAAAFIYCPGDALATTIHRMKYGHDTSLCHFAGRLMASDALCHEILSTADILVPIPLSRQRERERGYNQSRELCVGIASVVPIAICDTLLARKSFSQSQTMLTARERQENVEGAFSLLSAEGLRGKHIVLIDDIITTGATMRECLLQLRDIPDIEISILAFAKTSG
ncbi:MAG: ComF family protein [Prevotella sp.]